jgi:hypothetical protein
MISIKTLPRAQAVTVALNYHLAQGGQARDVFEAMVTSGKHTRESAFNLLWRAYALCLSEIEFGLSNRWPDVVVVLGEGRTIEELWPPGLYRREGARN